MFQKNFLQSKLLGEFTQSVDFIQDFKEIVSPGDWKMFEKDCRDFVDSVGLEVIMGKDEGFCISNQPVIEMGSRIATALTKARKLSLYPHENLD